MQHKTTNKLFKGKYQYKIVLVTPGAQLFRSGNMEETARALDWIDLSKNASEKIRRNVIKTKEDLQYATKIMKRLAKMQDCEIRVESPWISIYTNSKKDINLLSKIDENNVKYISSPPTGVTLSAGTIIMSKRDFDYKITLGRTLSENSSFVQWAEAHADKVQLTKSCKRHLLQHNSWGGSHFYLTGDNVLLMAKMHLGGSICKIERITKQ